MQRERTCTGGLEIRGRYLGLAALAVVILAAAGLIIPLTVLSGSADV